MGRAAWAPRTVGEDCACARSGGRTEAGGAEPEQRWWAGTEARPIVPPPPNHPLCRGACAALGRRGGGAARAALSVAAMDLGGCPFSALVVCVPKPATRAVLSAPG